MKKIKLQNVDKYILVDDEDFDYVNQIKWYENISNNSITIRSKFPENLSIKKYIMEKTIDYNNIVKYRKRVKIYNKNNNLYDLRKENLLIGRTTGKLKIKGSKLKGVYWHNIHELWQAKAFNNAGKLISLGYYHLEETAAKVYDYYIKKNYKNFNSFINYPDNNLTENQLQLLIIEDKKQKKNFFNKHLF